jgi:hypothetical protein
MSATRTALRGALVAGSVVAAAFATRRLADERPADIIYGEPFERTPPRPWGAGYGGMPVVFHHSTSFEAAFGADIEAVRAALPSSDLHPVRLPGGRAIVFVAGLRHAEVTANGVDGLCALPYGEVMVGALVTRRAAPPLVPLMAPASTGLAAGVFVLHLPVTTRVARDVGREAWGYAKFVADIEFDEGIVERRVRLSEGGRHILTLSVRPSGRPSVRSTTQAFYSVLGDELIETLIPTHGFAQSRWGRQGARLELGDHQVADELRGLSLGPGPILSTSSPSQRLVMPLGRAIGSARRHPGYMGEDRDLARYIVRYPGASAVDQYAPLAGTVGPSPTLGAHSGDATHGAVKELARA